MSKLLNKANALLKRGKALAKLNATDLPKYKRSMSVLTIKDHVVIYRADYRTREMGPAQFKRAQRAMKKKLKSESTKRTIKVLELP